MRPARRPAGRWAVRLVLALALLVQVVACPSDLGDAWTPGPLVQSTHGEGHHLRCGAPSPLVHLAAAQPAGPDGPAATDVPDAPPTAGWTTGTAAPSASASPICPSSGRDALIAMGVARN